MKKQYLQHVRLIERLHRQFLEVVKNTLDIIGIEDINSIQSLILFNIADQEMTVGDLTKSGYYLGSNVSYNVSRLAQNGYLEQNRSTNDRRSVKIRLSEKGRELCNNIDNMVDEHLKILEGTRTVTNEKLDTSLDVLYQIEDFWSDLARPKRVFR